VAPTPRRSLWRRRVPLFFAEIAFFGFLLGNRKNSGVLKPYNFFRRIDKVAEKMNAEGRTKNEEGETERLKSRRENGGWTQGPFCHSVKNLRLKSVKASQVRSRAFYTPPRGGGSATYLFLSFAKTQKARPPKMPRPQQLANFT
jgi:hypothetical protein